MPVTVVEALQMVRVEAVSEICGETERLEGPRLPQTRRDRAVAIDLLPCPLVALSELGHAHVQRQKDNMLTVVELPVAGQDPSLLFEASVQRRPGEWRQHREAREVDAV